MPALISGTQALGEPRYPSLKGIMAARVEGDHDAHAGGPGHRPVDGRPRGRDEPVVGTRAPEPRAATRVIREPAAEAARQVVDFLAERRLI